MSSRDTPAWLTATVFTFALAACDGDGFNRIPEVAAETNPSSRDAQSSRNEATDTARLPQRQVESAQDAALSSKVEAALQAEPDLHGASIAVQSEEGVVTLRGTTKDSERRSMAANVALSVEGVKHVRNEIALAREA